MCSSLYWHFGHYLPHNRRAGKHATNRRSGHRQNPAGRPSHKGHSISNMWIPTIREKEIAKMQRMSPNIANQGRTSARGLLPPLPNRYKNQRWIKVLHTKDVWVFHAVENIYKTEVNQNNLSIGNWFQRVMSKLCKGKFKIELCSKEQHKLELIPLWSGITLKQKHGRGTMTTVQKLNH